MAAMSLRPSLLPTPFVDEAAIGPMTISDSERSEADHSLDQQVERLSRRLAELRILPGEVVLYQGGQRVEALVMFWAAMAQGAVFVPIDETWPDYIVERTVAALTPRMVVCNADRSALFERLFPGAPVFGLSAEGDADGGGRSPGGSWSDWLDGAEPSRPPHASVPGQAPAVYLFTSGSSGLPKPVVLSRNALAHGARVTLRTFDWRPGDRLVNLPEPHTMSGLRNAFVAAALGGLHWTPLGAADRPNIFALLEAIEHRQPTRLVVGPALIRQIVMLGDRVNPGAFASIQAIYCTGAMLNPAGVARFHERFGVPVVNYYGLTETGGICISQRLHGWRADDTSVGVAAGAELRVVSVEAPPSPIGVGELQVRSPQLMTGYHDDPERTAARLDHGWLRTGDLARIDPDGRVHLLGRSDNVIKAASTDRIAPEEVEAVLEEHPAVAEAAVLGVDTEHGYQRIVALIVPGTTPAGATAAELASFTEARLGASRTPSQFRFVERLPRRATGKIVRSELMELIHERT